MPGYSVYSTDRNQHGGGILLLMRKAIMRDRFKLSVTSILETVAVIVYITHQNLLIVSGYNPPHNSLSYNDLEAVFAGNVPTVLLGESKHVAWNCETIDRNGKTLLEYFTDRAVNIYAPVQATSFRPRGQDSVLDIALARGSSLSPPLSISSLSSDHNPVVCKIRNTPKLSEHRPQYAYEYSNWNKHRSTLDYFLSNQSQNRSAKVIDRAIHFFTASVRLAAESSIPKRSDNTRRLHIPPAIRAAMKIRNYFRRRYQRTRHIVYYWGLQLLNRVLANHWAEFRNAK
jgi:hypothetical protein